MAENDVKRFYWSKHLTSFSAMKYKKDFFDKSKVALEFLQHRGSKLKFINLEPNYQFFRFSTGNTTFDKGEPVLSTFF